MSTVRIDEGYSWAVPVGGFIANFIVGGLAKSYAIIMKSTQDLFDTPAWPLTLAGGLIYAFMYCLSLVGIFLSQKYGCRTVVNIGATGCVISFVGAFFTTTVTQWVVCIGGGVGVSLAFIYSPIFVMVGRCFRKRVGLAMGISVAGVSIGQIAFPSIISYVIETYGARGAFLVGGGIASHFYITAALMPRYIADEEVQNSPKSNGNKRTNKTPNDSLEKVPLNDMNNGNLQGDDIERQKKTKSTFTRLNVVLLIIFIAAKVFGDVGDVGVAFALPLFGEDSRNLSNQEISLAIAVAGGVDLGTRVFVGLISDQPWCRRSLLLTSAWLLEACNNLFFVWFPSKAAYFVFYGIFGLTSGMAITLMTVVLTDFVGYVNLPVSFAVMMFVLGLVISPGQFLVGYLKDVTGDYNWSMWFLAINLFLAFAIISLEYPVKKFFFDTTAATDVIYCDRRDRSHGSCEKMDEFGRHHKDSYRGSCEKMDEFARHHKDSYRDPRSRLSSISALSNMDVRDILTTIQHEVVS